MLSDKTNESPRVSLILLNWNGRKIIGSCLRSIFAQSYQELEIIVVDCASSDGSVEYISRSFPDARIIALPNDYGTPYAYNQGVLHSNGSLVMIMNNDVILGENTVSSLVKQMGNEDKVLVPIELTFEGKFRSIGWTMWIGDVLARTIVKPPPSSPFYPSQACLMTTKRLLQNFKFNENFFMFEDSEWGWRLQLSGYKLEVAFKSFFFHKGSQTKEIYSRKQLFLYGRARIGTYFICLRYPTFLLLFPLIATQYLYDLISCAKHHKLRNAFQSLFGFIDFFRNFSSFRRDHKMVQEKRVYSDREMIMRMVSAARLIIEYVNFTRQ